MTLSSVMLTTILFAFSPLIEESPLKSNPYPKKTPIALYDELFARKRPEALFFAPGLIRCSIDVKFDGVIEKNDYDMISYLKGVKQSVKLDVDLEKIYTHKAKFSGAPKFQFIVQSKFVSELEKLHQGQDVELFITFCGTYKSTYLFMVNGIRLAARQPNPPLNPDAASASHCPRPSFGFLVTPSPRRFGSAG